MEIRKALLIAAGLVTGSGIYAQKVLTEGILVYDITIQTGSKEPQMADMLDGSSSTVYLKGSQLRTDMVNALGKESTICDARTGNVVILKEYSSQKLMITLTKENWADLNKKYSDMKFTVTNETKQIAGYTCKKAVGTLDGMTIPVYFCPEITVNNKDYNTMFKNLSGGLVMAYEIELGKMKFNYTLSKISFDPVIAARFDVPKSGYRVMTYEENQQLKKGNQ